MKIVFAAIWEFLCLPEDISVVGFDNYLYPGMADKKITSYQVNMKAMVRSG